MTHQLGANIGAENHVEHARRQGGFSTARTMA
jgi:hypothetical protein